MNKKENNNRFENEAPRNEVIFENISPDKMQQICKNIQPIPFSRALSFYNQHTMCIAQFSSFWCSCSQLNHCFHLFLISNATKLVAHIYTYFDPSLFESFDQTAWFFLITLSLFFFVAFPLALSLLFRTSYSTSVFTFCESCWCTMKNKTKTINDSSENSCWIWKISFLNVITFMSYCMHQISTRNTANLKPHF